MADTTGPAHTVTEPGLPPLRRRRSDVRAIAADLHRDAHLESEIPHRFLWAADAVAMALAFLIDLLIAPAVQQIVAPGGPLHMVGLNWLLLPGERLTDVSILGDVWGVLVVTVPVTIAAIELLGGYHLIGHRSRARTLATACAGPLAGLSAFTTVVFFLHTTRWSRVFVFTYVALSATAIAISHLALRTYKARRLAAGRYARAVALVGEPAGIAEVVSCLSDEDRTQSYRLVGFFHAGHETYPKNLTLAELGTVEQVRARLVHTPIDLVVVVLPDHDAPWLEGVIRACDYLRVSVQVIPASLLSMSTRLKDLHPVRTGGPFPVPGVVLQPWDTSARGLFLKRVFDATVATILLLLLSPLFVIIAIAIKLTTPKEEIFYKWKVIGYKGRPFTGYKFTTMVSDADVRRQDLMHLNEMTGPVFKIKNDPRITPLGRYLRKFSLNELPQLWSVVTGDMSLVGPRPAGSWEIGDYQDWHKRKLSFRPGITCLWQVRGRNKISSFDDWVRMDLEYIDHWSFWLDMKILMRTAWVVVAGSGS